MIIYANDMENAVMNYEAAKVSEQEKTNIIKNYMEKKTAAISNNKITITKVNKD